MHVELSDDTFVAADRVLVATRTAEPDRPQAWWPDLAATLTRDRGPKGRQWVLTGSIPGTAEIWLEPWHDGTIVHLFLRLDLPAGTSPARARRCLDRRARRWKRDVHRLKDELEAGRAAGAQVAPPG